ncbi:O-methyltransferase [Aspergillus phoenicis ATCC 13157]|uniref:catechol O-methyltransferase n=1 Tax=Aspergillus phoenicis ATCC 13157 TaxID=1353007 RepID=A0A370PCP0_ASPPH|nr:O-methyltransferase [Aspergillus phoenicis ATCC 13157]
MSVAHCRMATFRPYQLQRSKSVSTRLVRASFKALKYPAAPRTWLQCPRSPLTTPRPYQPPSPFTQRLLSTMGDSATPEAPSHPPVERSREDGRERKLLHFIYDQPNRDEIQGNPAKVLDLIEEFGKTYHFMNIGRAKGKFIIDIIEEKKPEVMIELGGYVGYSAILFGDAVRRAGGRHYYSLELNPEFAAIANMLLELAVLRDFVTILVGRSDLSLDKLFSSGHVKHVEVMLIDHYKPAYTADLKLCEQLGKIVPGVSVVVADNVLYPGNPPYLEYVRSTVEQKREAAKKGPVQAYDTTNLPQRSVGSFMPADATPSFELTGNPNLVYDSKLVKPETTRDAIEVSRCVGIQE